MHDVITLAIRAVAGGGLVAAFALLSEALKPKRFAGLFGAAPAIAVVGLTVSVLDKGAHAAQQESLGMIAGAVGMIAYAAGAIRLLRSGRCGCGAGFHPSGPGGRARLRRRRVDRGRPRWLHARVV